MQWKQIFLSVMISISMSGVYAANEFRCVSVPLQSKGNNQVLPGPDKLNGIALYFFKNRTTQSVWLDHPVSHPSLSAGWSSYLRPNRWSAILLTKKNFELQCAAIHPGQVEYYDCKKVIYTCVPESILMNIKRKGSYWIVEDQPWNEFIQLLQKRGIHLVHP